MRSLIGFKKTSEPENSIYLLREVKASNSYGLDSYTFGAGSKLYVVDTVDDSDHFIVMAEKAIDELGREYAVDGSIYRMQLVQGDFSDEFEDVNAEGDLHSIVNPGVHCTQCGKPMNPVERMLGPVCGKCVRKNHAEVTGRGASLQKKAIDPTEFLPEGYATPNPKNIEEQEPAFKTKKELSDDTEQLLEFLLTSSRKIYKKIDEVERVYKPSDAVKAINDQVDQLMHQAQDITNQEKSALMGKDYAGMRKKLADNISKLVSIMNKVKLSAIEIEDASLKLSRGKWRSQTVSKELLEKAALSLKLAPKQIETLLQESRKLSEGYIAELKLESKRTAGWLDNVRDMFEGAINWVMGLVKGWTDVASDVEASADILNQLAGESHAQDQYEKEMPVASKKIGELKYGPPDVSYEIDTNLTCPSCGSHDITPSFGHRLNKCLDCHTAFDASESEEPDEETEASLQKRGEEVSEHNWSVEYNNGKVTSLSLGNWSDAGWHWDGDESDILIFLVRMATSQVRDEFDKELQSNPDFASAINNSLQRMRKSKSALQSLYYSITGDNRGWEFGENYQYITEDSDIFDVDAIREALGKESDEFTDEQIDAAIRNAGVPNFSMTKKEEDALMLQVGKDTMEKFDFSDADAFMGSIQGANGAEEWARQGLFEQLSEEYYQSGQYDKDVALIINELKKNTEEKVEQTSEELESDPALRNQAAAILNLEVGSLSDAEKQILTKAIVNSTDESGGLDESKLRAYWHKLTENPNQLKLFSRKIAGKMYQVAGEISDFAQEEIDSEYYASLQKIGEDTDKRFQVIRSNGYGDTSFFDYDDYDEAKAKTEELQQQSDKNGVDEFWYVYDSLKKEQYATLKQAGEISDFAQGDNEQHICPYCDSPVHEMEQKTFNCVNCGWTEETTEDEYFGEVKEAVLQKDANLDEAFPELVPLVANIEDDTEEGSPEEGRFSYALNLVDNGVVVVDAYKDNPDWEISIWKPSKYTGTVGRALKYLNDEAQDLPYFVERLRQLVLEYQENL